MAIDIDTTEKIIIEALSDVPYLTVVDLIKKTGLTQPVCVQILPKLRSRNIVKVYSTPSTGVAWALVGEKQNIEPVALAKEVTKPTPANARTFIVSRPSTEAYAHDKASLRCRVHTLIASSDKPLTVREIMNELFPNDDIIKGRPAHEQQVRNVLAQSVKMSTPFIYEVGYVKEDSRPAAPYSQKDESEYSALPRDVACYSCHPNATRGGMAKTRRTIEARIIGYLEHLAENFKSDTTSRKDIRDTFRTATEVAHDIDAPSEAVRVSLIEMTKANRVLSKKLQNPVMKTITVYSALEMKEAAEAQLANTDSLVHFFARYFEVVYDALVNRRINEIDGKPEGVTMADISEETGLEGHIVTRVLKVLEENGVVRREKSDKMVFVTLVGSNISRQSTTQCDQVDR